MAPRSSVEIKTEKEGVTSLKSWLDLAPVISGQTLPLDFLSDLVSA
jgi:hypothetical protein